MRLITFVNWLVSLYNNIQGDEMKNKNIVVDYVTQSQACEIIGINKKSTPLINRWIKDGRIVGAFKFGKTIAIPIAWVKSECLSRNINFNGIELKPNEVGVSLKDYEPLIDYTKRNNLKYGTIHSQMTRGAFEKDFVKFDTSFGIRK